MINTQELELPLSGTYFHGSKGVQAFEILLYMNALCFSNAEHPNTNQFTSESRSVTLYQNQLCAGRTVWSDVLIKPDNYMFPQNR